MKNSDVVKRWKEGKKGCSCHMRTDGNLLYSYNLEIGYTKDNKKILRNYTSRDIKDNSLFGISGRYISQTTSHHVSAASSVADKMETGR